MKATGRLHHRPVPLCYDAPPSRSVHEPSVIPKVKLDDEEVLVAFKSIQERVEGRFRQSLAPDLARAIHHSHINEVYLQNFDQHIDGLDTELENLLDVKDLLGVKDLLLTASKAAVSTSSVHLQPVQELGGSRNLYIELPVRNIPKPVLSRAAFNWKKELAILTAIAMEDFCDKASDGEFCLETKLSKDLSLRSSTSVGELNADDAVGPTTSGAIVSDTLNQSRKRLDDEAELVQIISYQDTQTDRSPLLS